MIIARHSRKTIDLASRIPTKPGLNTPGLVEPGSKIDHQAQSAVVCSASHMRDQPHIFEIARPAKGVRGCGRARGNFQVSCLGPSLRHDLSQFCAVQIRG